MKGGGDKNLCVYLIKFALGYCFTENFIHMYVYLFDQVVYLDEDEVDVVLDVDLQRLPQLGLDLFTVPKGYKCLIWSEMDLGPNHQRQPLG